MKKYLSLLLGVALILSLAACGSTDKNNNETSIDEQVSENSEAENTENTENLAVFQDVNKPEVGLTMSLTGEYADCIITDLTEEQYKAINETAINGFNISKTINGKDYILSTVAVISNGAVSTPEQRASFPYIFAGSSYSIVATLPMADMSDTEVYEKISQLQAGIMQQLCTIFFDETSLTTDSVENGTINVDNVVESEVVVETESIHENETTNESEAMSSESVSEG